MKLLEISHYWERSKNLSPTYDPREALVEFGCVDTEEAPYPRPTDPTYIGLDQATKNLPTSIGSTEEQATAADAEKGQTCQEIPYMV